MDSTHAQRSTGPSTASSQLPTLDDVHDGLVEGVGQASEALEYIERARGHLYSFHQLTGQADFRFGDAADTLDAAGEPALADELRRVVVGRNVLPGRWTFQVVDEYDDLYYDVVAAAVRSLEARLMGGHRHVHEARLKAQRRTVGLAGHEATPADVPHS